jgi:hypothetical protein
MHSFETPPTNGHSAQPPHYSLELLSNLIYLSRRIDTHSDQQHRYLDWAARVIEDLGSHPMLKK